MPREDDYDRPENASTIGRAMASGALGSPRALGNLNKSSVSLQSLDEQLWDRIQHLGAVLGEANTTLDLLQGPQPEAVSDGRAPGMPDGMGLINDISGKIKLLEDTTYRLQEKVGLIRNRIS